jgi:hypothetical protein
VMLTGGATDKDGKTWKIDSSHPEGDKFADADEELTKEETLTSGIFGTALGLSEVYDDEFTFYFDGSYKHDVKEDKASFAALVNQLVLNGGANVVHMTKASQGFGLCTAGYTPEADAKFTVHEEKDYDVPSMYGPDGLLTFAGVNTLSFSGTEFIAFLDVNREVIIQEISASSMRLVIFINADPDKYPKATHALVLSFKAVN